MINDFLSLIQYIREFKDTAFYRIYRHRFFKLISIFFQQECEYDSLALSSKLGNGEIRKHGVFCGFRLPPGAI